MEVSMRGAVALRQLRHELQDSAGEDFPQGILTELLVLHDVCRSLQMNVFQAREILGESAWRCIVEHIEKPAPISVNWSRVSE